jgi:hypothetical protein
MGCSAFLRPRLFQGKRPAKLVSASRFLAKSGRHVCGYSTGVKRRMIAAAGIAAGSAGLQRDTCQTGL